MKQGRLGECLPEQQVTDGLDDDVGGPACVVTGSPPGTLHSKRIRWVQDEGHCAGRRSVCGGEQSASVEACRTRPLTQIAQQPCYARCSLAADRLANCVAVAKRRSAVGGSRNSVAWQDRPAKGGIHTVHLVDHWGL